MSFPLHAHTYALRRQNLLHTDLCILIDTDYISIAKQVSPEVLPCQHTDFDGVVRVERSHVKTNILR